MLDDEKDVFKKDTRSCRTIYKVNSTVGRKVISKKDKTNVNKTFYFSITTLN